MNFKLSAVLISLTLAGCAGTNTTKDEELDSKVDETILTADKLLNQPAYTVSKTPKMAVSGGPVSVVDSNLNLLKNQTVRYIKGSESVPLSAILNSLNSQGINIVSQINLDRFRYSGFSINDTDALTALEILTGTLGLDFTVEKMSSGLPLVYINTLSAEVRRLNIGPRDVKSRMGTKSAGESLQTGQQQQQSEIQLSTSTIGGLASAEISSTFDDNFWAKLQTELEQLLLRPVPRSRSQASNSDAESDGNGMYEMMKLGHVVVNSSTGSITVMAPRTIRREIMAYIDDIDAELNSTVILRGQVILVNNDKQDSEGIDWGGLINTGEGILSVGNDVLGNVTMSLPGEFADIVASNVLSPSLIGYQRADKVIRAFNGYLERDSNTKTMQMPVAQTASGTPVNLSDVQNEFQILVSTDQSRSDGGTTNTGAKNNILTFQYGTNLTMTPRVDLARGLIRTDVNLQLKIKQGTGVYSQLIASGDSAELSPLELPLIKDISFQGQAILRPGEVIVMGGQKVELFEENKGGITGLKDGIFGGLFSQKKGKRQTVTYYFLLSAYTIPYGS